MSCPAKIAGRLGALAVSMTLIGCANVVRIAPHTELKVVDPMWTTAYITRNHGYLVYDTLFALDENYEPKPQMVSRWHVSADNKVWAFTLRDGLKWHDGSDVTAADCVASLQRWAKRDGVGQQLFRDLESIAADDARSFTLRFRQPTTLVLDAMAKMSANVPFMLPKRVADTDPFVASTDTVGSGPFVYSRSASEPGVKTVYIRNKEYVPRSEPQSLAAGGKVAKADRIEWLYYPGQAAAVTALMMKQVDYVESPSTRQISQLEARKDLVVASTDPLGNVAMMRFNTQVPPFDRPAVRLAVLKAVQQKEYMAAALGDERFWRECHSVFPCGTPLSSDVSGDRLKGGSLDEAKKLLAASGYDGTPVIVLNPTDNPVISALTLVTVGKLRELGMTVQVEDMTWAALTERRVSRAKVSQGGWSMFHTWWLAADVMDPMSIVFSGDPENGWYGWPNDPVLEGLRSEYAKAGNAADKKAIAAKVQKQVVDSGILGILGQFFEPVAYSARVNGITTPIQFYWNLWIDQ